MFIDNIKYTWEHKKAFVKTERLLTGKNTLRGYAHDLDKLLMYLVMPKKMASKIHRSFSKHHIRSATTEEDYIQMVIDWECARYTKKDKPMNAYKTLYVIYPQLESKILPLLQKYGLCKGENYENNRKQGVN